MLLAVAALLAGALNAVAGGGTFLTFPALLYTGVPPVAANATSTVALLPGYLSGAYGFRREVGPAAGAGGGDFCQGSGADGRCQIGQCSIGADVEIGGRDVG